MKANKSIREKAKSKGVRLWQIAAYLGVSEPTITRWLRIPLSPEKQRAFSNAIDEITKEGGL